MSATCGREAFEARMRGLKCTVNLQRYKTGRDEYCAKTVEAAWQTWLEAWCRAAHEGRKIASEGRRIAYRKGIEDGRAAAYLATERASQEAKS